MDFKDHWSLDTALKVVQNQTVDSQLWAEAVEWLLLYGPPEIVSILLKASGYATQHCLPELQIAGQAPPKTSDQASFADPAQPMAFSEKDLKKIIEEREDKHQTGTVIAGNWSKTIH